MPGNNRSKTNSPEPELSGASRIKELVQKYRVCWEVYPVQILAKGGIRKIGFNLELYGTPECGAEHILPGCEHCIRVEAALEEIADWILLRETPSCSHIVASEGASLSYAPARTNRPDVVLHVLILHRQELHMPLDDCELRCLKDVEQALTEVGACEGRWSGAREESPADLARNG